MVDDNMDLSTLLLLLLGCSVFLVFEYCEHDLARVLDTHPHAFSGVFRASAKCQLYQYVECRVYCEHGLLDTHPHAFSGLQADRKI
jgi:hypothetical protein